jgi:hypothetical protein
MVMRLFPRFGETGTPMLPNIIITWMKWWPIFRSAKNDRVANSWIGEMWVIDEVRVLLKPSVRRLRPFA